MRYLIIDIEKLELYPYNSRNELIKQLEPRTEVTSTPEEPLENIIFNTRLFNTPEKLGQLKRVIGSFISENPAKDEMKVDANTKNQFFYLYAALWSLPNLLSDDSMVSFIRQMAVWFPEWIPLEKKMLRNYELSLSHEKKKWEQNKKLLKVTEWKTFVKRSGMSIKKAEHFEALAMMIYTTVNLIVKDIRSRKH